MFRLLLITLLFLCVPIFYASLTFPINFFFLHLFIFRERGMEGERKGEKHQYVVASHMTLTGDLACNPGMCPDWESNQWPFGLQASTQSTEPHQPGLFFVCFIGHMNDLCWYVYTLGNGVGGEWGATQSYFVSWR